MKLYISCLFILFLFAVPSIAQETNEIPRVKISDLYIGTGFYVENAVPANLSDFHKLAANSIILPKNLDGFSSSDWNSSGGGMTTASIGLKFRKKDGSVYHSNPLLRIGIKSSNANVFSASYQKESRSRFDTLSSNSSGEIAYLDSVNSTYYSMDYTSRHLRLDLSLIFRTNPEKRWSLYGGLGLSAGIFYNAETEITKSDQYYVEFEYKDVTASSEQYFYNEDNYKTEYHRNKNGFGTELFAPVGVDFRISKSGFFSKIHLLYEIQAALNMTNIPEMETIVSGRMNHQIGLRLNL